MSSCHFESFIPVPQLWVIWVSECHAKTRVFPPFPWAELFEIGTSQGWCNRHIENLWKPGKPMGKPMVFCTFPFTLQYLGMLWFCPPWTCSISASSSRGTSSENHHHAAQHLINYMSSYVITFAPVLMISVRKNISENRLHDASKSP